MIKLHRNFYSQMAIAIYMFAAIVACGGAVYNFLVVPDPFGFIFCVLGAAICGNALMDLFNRAK